MVKKPKPRVHVGARKKTDGGYWMIKVESGRWRYEHRVIAEIKIGRSLKRWEQVHHVNRVRDDNRPENLEVMTKKEHKALHRALGRTLYPKCPICGWKHPPHED
jgi:PDZ domain-containing secreted protein